MYDKPKSASVVLGYGFGQRYINSDTIFIPIRSPHHINDTIKKYLSQVKMPVKSLLIAQPSLIVDSIDFSFFPRLEEMTLSGNDDDVLQQRRYNFFAIKSLRRIYVNAVFVENGEVREDSDDCYTCKSRKKFIRFVHEYRPDIRVRWPKNFDYQTLWTQ